MSKATADDSSESLESIGKEIITFVRKIVKKKLLIKAHWMIYCVMIIVAIIIDSNFSVAEDPWWPWMATGWLFGLLIHTYFFITRGMKSWFHFHVFFYIILSSFLIFIDGYADFHFEWFWYPLLIWAVILGIHWVIGLRGTVFQEEVLLYAILISDSNGKTLVKVEQEPEFMKKHLHMDESSVELIPMLINTILQFSKEINMMDCNDFRLQNAELKVITYAGEDLICTGFISSNSNTHSARIILKHALDQIQAQFPKEIKLFITHGIEGPFEQYKTVIKNIMEKSAYTA
jgi:hypothetical protein